MTNIQKHEQYHDYELVLEWFKTDGKGELPAQYQNWLKLWKFADQLVCVGHLDMETIAKMMVKEFPEEKLTFRSALKHVVNAQNYYNSSQNLSRKTVRRVLARQIDNLIAILYEVLPSDPINVTKQIGALIKEKREILQLHLKDEDVGEKEIPETVVIFDTDHKKHGYPGISEKDLKKMFREWEEAEIIDESERNQLEQEVGIEQKNSKAIPQSGTGRSAKG
ncbi:hypothetical protein [uncultured Draconibacterium sp.]|uniref:hypothetical protein n=1 Tax=uncultured Draconibacterium sp. TaxID=1573823 RepID=UPI0025E383EA|nr:hypothetical protein [uncultured Draconibacterium sp.]